MIISFSEGYFEDTITFEYSQTNQEGHCLEYRNCAKIRKENMEWVSSSVTITPKLTFFQEVNRENEIRKKLKREVEQRLIEEAPRVDQFP